MDEFKPDIIHTYLSGYEEFPQLGKDYNGIVAVNTNVFGHHNPNPNIFQIYMSDWLQRYVARKWDVKGHDFIFNPVVCPVAIEYYKNFDNKIKKLNGPNSIVLGRTGRDDNGIYTSIAVDAINLLCEKRPELRRNIIFYVMNPPSQMIEDLKKYKINYLVHPKTISPIELENYLFSLDIYCHFREDGESGGLNLQEAMMYKLPCITHISRPKDPSTFPFQAQCSLVENGRTGFVVDGAKQYSETLETLIDNPDLRQKMGEAGYEKAMKNFEVNVCVDKLERIYKELLNEQN